MSPGGPKAVAFDWGGVFTVGTFDSNAVVALADLIGVSADELEPTYLRLMVDFEAGAHGLDGFHRRFSEATSSRTDPERFRKVFLGAVRERPETYALVAALPARLRLGVLSNNVAELCDLVRDDPRLSRVETFVFSNEIRVRKPDPAAYQALVDGLGEEPSEVVFVDDNAGNVEAAKRFGLRAVLFGPGFPDRFTELFPDAEIPSAFTAPGWR